MSGVVPFYVVCFNRIRGLLSALEFAQRSTIALQLNILDMGSSWEPFIRVRDALDCPVIYIEPGLGPRDLWTNGTLSRLGEGGFFLSDGDLDYSSVPSDAAEKMIAMSNQYPWFPKVGLALRIDDLPLDQEADRVKLWEKPSWSVKWDLQTFLAPLDTTMAYYPSRDKTFFYRPGLRIAGPYQAIHYPWYERDTLPDEESFVYRKIASSRISSTQAGTYPSFLHRIKRSILLAVSWLARPLLRNSRTAPHAVSLLALKGKIIAS